jgi:type IV fimbrial biogenesis protein FimT
MITILVMVIVLAIGVPSFRDLIAHTRMTTATNSLIAHLQYARSEAVKRSATITVCPSQGGAACDNTADWTGGFIVAVGSAGAVTQVLRRVGGSDMRGVTVTKNGNYPRFQFEPDGSAQGYQASLTVCGQSGADDNIRQVRVSSVGRSFVACNDPAAYACPVTCP